jgi:predicted AlkP superfamily phosphohydrolase/phosphomutase
MDEDIPADKLVSVYRRIRTAIDEKEEEHKQVISDLKDKLELVSERLLKLCNDQNVDSLRTMEGTVTRRIKSRFWTTDWESMYKFIKEQDAPFLLEQRIHIANMRQFLDENPDLHPAGLQEDRKYAITVRKPTNK